MNQKNWIWVGIAATLAATATWLLIRRARNASGKPPRKAPQIPINNPGEQSEFSTAASESELG